MDDKTRRAVERRIVKKAIETMIKAGYFVSVDDGKELVCRYTKDKNKVSAAMMSVAEERMYVAIPNITLKSGAKPFKRIGSFLFVYGSGFDIIADNSMCLKEHRAAIDVYVENQRKIYG